MTIWYHISTTAVPMTTKLGRMVTYLEGLLPIKSHDPLILCCSKITWQTKSIIPPLPHCLTKLDRMVTCLEGLAPIKSNEPLITCSYQITWQGKTIISPLPQCLWPANLAWCWLTLKSTLKCYLALARSRYNLKPLHLFYHNALGHQTW